MSVPFEHKAGTGLDHLGLAVARAQLDATCQRAAAEEWSYSHFLGYLLDAEIDARHQQTVRLNLQFSRLPYLKRLDGFDFKAQPSVDRRMVDELTTGRFLSEGRNLVFLGPPGVGKTHLAIALGVLTAEMGHLFHHRHRHGPSSHQGHEGESSSARDQQSRPAQAPDHR